MPLTPKDLNNIKSLVKVTLDENQKFVTKDDIKHLPTKEEFYGKMDEVMGELKVIREEQTILSGVNRKVNDLAERTVKIEHKLQLRPAV
jgi:uncharacterized protein YigA (DUF484 family)